ncbi:MAG TPA: translation initiation factor [Candidatus Thermoplasmatota archaeon]|nr:translation initiation factor [Candidatus Thermoplasmatota archaeon]
MSGICDTCGLPADICVCEEIARESQEITIHTVERRYGKLVTVVDGFDSSDIDMDTLCSKLKAACACGGTRRDGKIELQGDHKGKVKAVLVELGFKADVR